MIENDILIFCKTHLMIENDILIFCEKLKNGRLIFNDQPRLSSGLSNLILGLLSLLLRRNFILLLLVFPVLIIIWLRRIKT